MPTCTLGTLTTADPEVSTGAAGGIDQYAIAVTVNSTGAITNQVTVTSGTPEANPGDESASETTESVVDPVVFLDGFESGNTTFWSRRFP